MENNLEPWEIEFNKVIQTLEQINEDIKEINDNLKQL